VEQIIQIAGSIFILIPFALVQARSADAHCAWFMVANVLGSGILAIDAAWTAQWGFLLLEGIWAAVSLVGLVSAVRARRFGPFPDRPSSLMARVGKGSAMPAADPLLSSNSSL